jgi:hypothetical protein
MAHADNLTPFLKKICTYGVTSAIQGAGTLALTAGGATVKLL